MKLAKGHVTIGLSTRFGPDWPGQRCGAKTRKARPVRGPQSCP